MSAFAEAFSVAPYAIPLYAEQVDQDFRGPCHDVYALFLPKTHGETYALFPPLSSSMERLAHTFMHLMKMVQTVGQIPNVHNLLEVREAAMEKLTAVASKPKPPKTAQGAPPSAAAPGSQEGGDLSVDEGFMNLGGMPPARPEREGSMPSDDESSDASVASDDESTDSKLSMLQPYAMAMGKVGFDVFMNEPHAIDATVYLVRVIAHAGRAECVLGDLIVAFMHGRDRIPIHLPAYSLFASELLFPTAKERKVILAALLQPFYGAPSTFSFGQSKQVVSGMERNICGNLWPHESLKKQRTFDIHRAFKETFPTVDVKGGWHMFDTHHGIFSCDTALACMRAALKQLNHGTSVSWTLNDDILSLLNKRHDGIRQIPRTMRLKDFTLVHPVPRDFQLLLSPTTSIYLHRHRYEGTPLALMLQQGKTVGEYIDEVESVLPSYTTAAPQDDSDDEDDGRLAALAGLASVPPHRSCTVTSVRLDIVDAGVPTYDGTRAIQPDRILEAGMDYTSMPTEKADMSGRYPTNLVYLLSKRHFGNHKEHVIEESLMEMERRINQASISSTLYSPAHTEVLKYAGGLLDNSIHTRGMRVRFPSDAPSTPLFDFSRGVYIFVGSVFFVNAHNRWATMMALMGAFFPKDRLHFMIEGDPGSGKSECIKKMQGMVLPSSFYSVTTQTLAAMMNAGEPYIVCHGALNVFDEMTGMLGPSSKHQANDPKQNEMASVMKVFTHEGAASRSLVYMSPVNGRQVQVFSVRGDFNLVGLTNLHFLSEMYIDAGLLDRAVVIFAKDTDRRVMPATEQASHDADGTLDLMFKQTKRIKKGQAATGADWRRRENEKKKQDMMQDVHNIISDFQDPNCHESAVQELTRSVQILTRVADEIMEILLQRAVTDARVFALLPDMQIYWAVEKTFQVALARHGITNPSNRKFAMASNLALSLSVLDQLLWCFYTDKPNQPVTLGSVLVQISRAVVTEDIAFFALAQVMSPDITRERAMSLAVMQYVKRGHADLDKIYRSLRRANDDPSDVHLRMGSFLSPQAPDESLLPPAINLECDDEIDEHTAKRRKKSCMDKLKRNREVQKELEEAVKKFEEREKRRLAAENSQTILENNMGFLDVMDPDSGDFVNQANVRADYDWTRILFHCPRNESNYRSAALALASEFTSLNLGFQVSTNELVYWLQVMARTSAPNLKPVPKALEKGKVVQLTVEDLARVADDHSSGKLVQKVDLDDRVSRSSLGINCIIAHNGELVYKDIMQMRRADGTFKDDAFHVGLGFFSSFGKRYLCHQRARPRTVVFNEPGYLGTHGHIPAHFIIKPNANVEIPPALKSVYDEHGVMDTRVPIEQVILKKKLAKIEQYFGSAYTNLPCVLSRRLRDQCSLSAYLHRKWKHDAGRLPGDDAQDAPPSVDYTLSRLVEEFDLPEM